MPTKSMRKREFSRSRKGEIRKPLSDQGFSFHTFRTPYRASHMIHWTQRQRAGKTIRRIRDMRLSIITDDGTEFTIVENIEDWEFNTQRVKDGLISEIEKAIEAAS